MGHVKKTAFPLMFGCGEMVMRGKKDVSFFRPVPFSARTNEWRYFLFPFVGENAGHSATLGGYEALRSPYLLMYISLAD